jgi:protein TonB
MKPNIRTGLVLLFLVAGSSGCSSVRTAAETVNASVEHLFHPAAPPAVSSRTVPAPTLAPPAGLDDYKTRVARHVVQHNPGHNYSGILPPLLPAIVVLEITVERDGQLADVAVQRARDPEAAQTALGAMRRSTPLPRPEQLARADGKLKFSETFLFADHERYQLRSLAAPQASE